MAGMNDLNLDEMTLSLQAAAHMKDVLEESVEDLNSLLEVPPSLVPSDVLYRLVRDYLKLYNHYLQNTHLSKHLKSYKTYH